MSNNEVEYVYNYENEYYPNSPKEEGLLNFIQAKNLGKVVAYTKANKSIPDNALLVAIREAVASSSNAEAEKPLQILNFLLSAGVNPNSVASIEGVTAMGVAAGSTGRVAPKVMQLLFDRGAEINPRDPKQIPPIFEAVQRGSLETLKKAVELGGLIDSKYPKQEFPLIYAAVIARNVDAVEYLLNKNVKINYINPIGDNILITAIKLDNPNARRGITALLLRQVSLKADFQNFSKKTALMIAAESGDLDIFNMFLNDNRFILSIPSRERNGKTVFDLVAEKSSLSPLEDKANVAIYDRFLELLLLKGGKQFPRAVEDIFLNQGTSLLQQAILLGNRPFAGFLVGIEGKNKFLPNGKTPLTFAIKERQLTIMNDLLKGGAKLDLKDKNGTTPFVEAFLTGDASIIEAVSKAFSTYLGRKPTQENYKDILVSLAKDPREVNYAQIFESLGIDPRNAPKHQGLSLLTMASAAGNTEFVRFLLEVGALPDDDAIDQPANQRDMFTPYGIAANITIRLLLAPYYEMDKPRFTGFRQEVFDNLESIFMQFDINNNNGTSRKVDRLVDGSICPICFSIVDREDGCMYVNHNCMEVKDKAAKKGSIIFVHKQLYDTYKQNNLIKWCCLCNRLTGDYVGHGHLHLDIAPPIYYKNVSALRTYLGNARIGDRGGDPFDKNCNKEAGGNMEEKIYRYQKLLDFYCLLNKEFIGKISNDMAERLVREYFIECPLIERSYFIQEDRFKPSSLPFEQKPVRKSKAILEFEQLFQTIMKDRSLQKPDDCYIETGEGNAEVVLVENNVAPNIPRHPNNTGLLPKVIAQVAMDEEEPVPPPRAAANNVMQKYQANYRAFKARLEERNIKKCSYHTEFHTDGRDLYQFFHRQPLRYGGGIYDHADSLICKEGLVEFIQFANMGTTILGCFESDKCKGHIHPLEIKPIFTSEEEQEIYEEYRKRFNKFPPANLRGGSQAQPYTHFYVDTNTTSGVCPLPRKRVIGGKKTRKQRQRKRRTTRKR